MTNFETGYVRRAITFPRLSSRATNETL